MACRTTRPISTCVWPRSCSLASAHTCPSPASAATSRASSSRVGDADNPRIAEHTDSGSFSLLMQDELGGLEILDPPAAPWYPVECNFPGLAIHVGDSVVCGLNCPIHSACHHVPRYSPAGM